MAIAAGGFREKLTTDYDHGFHGLEEEEPCSQFVALLKKGPFPMFHKETWDKGSQFDTQFTSSTHITRKKGIKRGQIPRVF